MKGAENSQYTKKEMFAWLGDLLKVEVNTIEDLSNGAIFCQLLDVISGGGVRMQKVNWNAKVQHENLANLKIVSSNMFTLNIDKKFDVIRVAQRKSLQILELLQWFRKYFLTNNFSTTHYDPLARRNAQAGGQKNSNEQRLPSEVIRQQKKLNLVKPAAQNKKEWQDIITDNELKTVLKINRDITKIVLEEPQAKADDKLQQIRKILLLKNGEQNQTKLEQQNGNDSQLHESSKIGKFVDITQIESDPKLKLQDQHNQVTTSREVSKQQYFTQQKQHLTHPNLSIPSKSTR